MERVAVLGGSTPFAAGLVDALAQEAGLPPCHLVLHGRDAQGLEAVAAYARAWLGPLGWRVEGAQTVEGAVDGAAVVIQQIRFGGMEGRAAD
ncbi:MAG TPA: hypothetical protein VFH27_06665, partial [Longimicrobiaceae bacterium]|nr:hypothetical protein [Longimicrobiaceae bacterium]